MLVLPRLKIGLTGVCLFRDVVLARGAFGDSVFGLLGCLSVASGIFFELVLMCGWHCRICMHGSIISCIFVVNSFLVFECVEDQV